MQPFASPGIKNTRCKVGLVSQTGISSVLCTVFGSALFVFQVFFESWTLCENTLRVGNGDSYILQQVFLQLQCCIMYLFLLYICILSFANSCTFHKFGMETTHYKMGWIVIAVWRRLQDFVQNKRGNLRSSMKKQIVNPSPSKDGIRV